MSDKLSAAVNEVREIPVRIPNRGVIKNLYTNPPTGL